MVEAAKRPMRTQRKECQRARECKARARVLSDPKLLGALRRVSSKQPLRESEAAILADAIGGAQRGFRRPAKRMPAKQSPGPRLRWRSLRPLPAMDSGTPLCPPPAGPSLDAPNISLWEYLSTDGEDEFLTPIQCTGIAHLSADFPTVDEFRRLQSLLPDRLWMSVLRAVMVFDGVQRVKRDLDDSETIRYEQMEPVRRAIMLDLIVQIAWALEDCNGTSIGTAPKTEHYYQNNDGSVEQVSFWVRDGIGALESCGTKTPGSADDGHAKVWDEEFRCWVPKRTVDELYAAVAEIRPGADNGDECDPPFREGSGPAPPWLPPSWRCGWHTASTDKCGRPRKAFMCPCKAVYTNPEPIKRHAKNCSLSRA